MAVDDNETSMATTVPAGTVVKRYVTNEATKFELIGPGTAQINRGEAATLTLTMPRSEQEHIEVKVEGDSIKVAHRGGLLRHREPSGPLQYELTISILTELKLSHGLTAEAANIDNRDVSVDLRDGSSLTLAQLGVSEVDAKVANGGRLSASGTVAKQKIRLADGSTYQGNGLESEEADIELAGGSEATVRVTRRLKAKATGGSTVSYSGDRIDLNIQTTEKSDFRHLAV
jgi:hypothetical protein